MMHLTAAFASTVTIGGSDVLVVASGVLVRLKKKKSQKNKFPEAQRRVAHSQLPSSGEGSIADRADVSVALYGLGTGDELLEVILKVEHASLELIDTPGGEGSTLEGTSVHTEVLKELSGVEGNGLLSGVDLSVAPVRIEYPGQHTRKTEDE